MKEFQKILEIHRKKYPLMEPADFAKLAYQSTYGPEHMAGDEAEAARAIAEEMEKIPAEGKTPLPEPVGGGLCRFYLEGRKDAAAFASVLAKLFCLTAKEHKGSPDGMERRLSLLEETGAPGIKEWLADYRKKGCPPVRHSRTYREAYQPHYRLLRMEYGVYMPVLLKIRALLEGGDPVAVAIDGRCGSGKTRLAELIGQIFPCNVFHMDDYYLPVSKRGADWIRTAGANMDFSRFLSEALRPVRQGEAALYRPYDCQSDRLLFPRVIPPRKLNVVEGSYSQHPYFSGQYDLKIFLTCPEEIQSARLREREGEYYDVFVKRWIPLEEQYIQKYDIIRNADLTIDTADL